MNTGQCDWLMQFHHLHLYLQTLCSFPLELDLQDCYNRPPVILTSITRTLSYPNRQINDIHYISAGTK